MEIQAVIYDERRTSMPSSQKGLQTVKVVPAQHNLKSFRVKYPCR